MKKRIAIICNREQFRQYVHMMNHNTPGLKDRVEFVYAERIDDIRGRTIHGYILGFVSTGHMHWRGEVLRRFKDLSTPQYYMQDTVNGVKLVETDAISSR